MCVCYGRLSNWYFSVRVEVEDEVYPELEEDVFHEDSYLHSPLQSDCVDLPDTPVSLIEMTPPPLRPTSLSFPTENTLKELNKSSVKINKWFSYFSLTFFLNFILKRFIQAKLERFKMAFAFFCLFCFRHCALQRPCWRGGLPS